MRLQEALQGLVSINDNKWLEVILDEHFFLVHFQVFESIAFWSLESSVSQKIGCSENNRLKSTFRNRMPIPHQGKLTSTKKKAGDVEAVLSLHLLKSMG